MASKQIADNKVNLSINTPESITEANEKDVSIESFTASNTTGIDASYKAYIKTASGILRAQVPFKIVSKNNIDLGIGLINQVIPAGAVLQVESSALDTIYFTVTGREI